MNTLWRIRGEMAIQSLEPGVGQVHGPYSFAWGTLARVVIWMLENGGRWPNHEASELIEADKELSIDPLGRIREIETMPTDGWTYSHGPLSCPSCPGGYRFHKDIEPGYVWCVHCFHRGTVAEFEAAYRELIEEWGE